jgi:ABC-2 type transport system ATP-binding protein
MDAYTGKEGTVVNAIETRKLTKRYRDVTAVDGLDLTIPKGELFALLGVNGAGKTTTIKMLSCLTRPTSGDAFLGGSSIVSEPARVKARIGVSPQETAVAPNLTVRENLALMCGVYGKPKDRTALLSDQLGLRPVLGKKAGKLSGGWQRRLSIAMALIGEPEILFLDEPTLGLDVLARSDLWEVISQLKGSMTMILTTHYMEEAEQLSDRIGIMKDGRLIALGTARELMDRAGTDRFEDAFVTIVKEGAK